MSTFTVVSTVTHRSLMNKSKDNLARWVLHLLDCRDEDERRRVQRITDLLEANNTYQQLARDAREALKRRFDLAAHLERQRAFSRRTFGPGTRAAGVIDHIRKELLEIEDDPTDVKEWIDVIILAFDGAWRAGYEPAQIVEAIVAKQAKNEKRRWPDWRTADPDKAIEHDRSGEASLSRARATNVRELLDESLEILNGIVDSVKRHGNYSPESTRVFIDQAGQCLREALSTLEPAVPVGKETRRGKSQGEPHKHGPDEEPGSLAAEQSGETSPGAQEDRLEADAPKARRLAEMAMDFLHHDADQETYDRHVDALTKKFARLTRGPVDPATRPAEQAVTGPLPQDVIDLVIAARIVAFEDQSPEALRALDLASEAFASRVPWDEDPEALKAAMEAAR